MSKDGRCAIGKGKHDFEAIQHPYMVFDKNLFVVEIKCSKCNQLCVRYYEKGFGTDHLLYIDTYDGKGNRLYRNSVIYYIIETENGCHTESKLNPVPEYFKSRGDIDVVVKRL